jgi:hypothetical protein
MSFMLFGSSRVHRTLQMPEYQTPINAALYLQQLCLSISDPAAAKSRVDASSSTTYTTAFPSISKAPYRQTVNSTA